MKISDLIYIGGNDKRHTFLYKDRRILVKNKDACNTAFDKFEPYFVNGFCNISNTLNPTKKGFELHTINCVGTLEGYKFEDEKATVIFFDAAEYSLYMGALMRHYFWDQFWAPKSQYDFTNGLHGLKIGGPIKVIKDD